MNYEIVLQQYIMITLLIGIGYFIAKRKVFSPKTVGELAVFLLKGITPLIVIENMVLKPSNLDMPEFFFLFIISLGIIGLGYGLTFVFKIEGSINKFAITFSNCGFVGIPLVTSFVDGAYVPYIIPFMIAQTLLVWTLGVVMMSDSTDNIDLKNVLKNPAVFSFIISLVLIWTKLKVPISIANTVSMLSSLNTPLAMIVLGTYVAGIDKEMLSHIKAVLLVSLHKLIIVPIISLLVLYFLPINDPNVFLTLLIVIACPTGTTAAMFSQIYGKDPVYTSSLVSFTTLFSLFTIPLLIIIAQSMF